MTIDVNEPMTPALRYVIWSRALTTLHGKRFGCESPSGTTRERRCKDAGMVFIGRRVRIAEDAQQFVPIDDPDASAADAPIDFMVTCKRHLKHLRRRSDLKPYAFPVTDQQVRDMFYRMSEEPDITLELGLTLLRCLKRLA